MRIGVLVPCRNEAEVIERKLRNLAQLVWPAAASEHRVVVVDDRSEDDTAERARRLVAELFPARPDPSRDRVRASVVENGVRPGKPGAIQQGIVELAEEVDLLVLTDADVVVDRGALVALARAFASDRQLAIACGVQRFVRDLAGDGTCRSQALGDPVGAAGLFDRTTALVRRCESRCGLLFSVHGQWLAWRASLRLAPRLGLAADDLDLMFQARARREEPRRSRLVPDAIFYEVKTLPGPHADEQALRRARAYVQVLRASRPCGGLVERLQWVFYRFAPLHAPACAVALGAAGLLAAAVLDARLAIVLALAIAAALASAVGRRFLRLMMLIRAATRLEAQGPLPERWEMARR